ncbi:MAG: WD40/YVTN/BNR-like repeat-containing protein [Gemmatimonadales bacterium]
MTNTKTAIAGIVLVFLGSALQAQRPRQPAVSRGVAARSDTSRADTSRQQGARARFVEATNIRPIGPAAYSGRVTSIAVPRSAEPRPKTFYIGSAGGGVWKTVNGGVTWQSVSSGLGEQTIGDLAVAPSDTNTLWAGTGEKNSLRSQYWGDGVYRSTNGGRAWTRMGLEDTRSIGRVVIHPTNPGTVYVAALGHLWGPNPQRGVFKTTDSGRTWTKVLFVDDTTGAVDLVMDPSNPEVLYAATWHRLRWGGSHMEGVGSGSGIWKTTDGGTTWTRLTDPAKHNGLPTERVGRIGLAISPQNPALLFALIQVDRGVTDPGQGRYGGVFRSSDGGASWTQVNDLAANPHYYYDDIVVDPADSNHLYVTSAQLLVSKDGGRSFTPDSLAHVHGDYHAVWIDPLDPAHLVIGNDGGAYVSNDRGRAWWHMPIPIGQFYTVIVDSSQTPYQLCGGLQDNGVWCGPSRTRDTSGITEFDWYPVNGGDGMWVQIPADDPFTVYSGWQFGNISRLDLKTWQRDLIQPQSLDAGAESGYPFTWGWTTPILVSQHPGGAIYVGANRLFRMHQGGNDWEIVGPDMTRTPRQSPAPEVGYTSYHAIFSIAESPKTPAILWTGSDDGLLWVTSDTGKTWANVTTNLPRGTPADCWVGTIVASYHAEGTAYVALDCHNRDDYSPHVLVTHDLGRTWTEIGQGLPEGRGSLTVLEDVKNPRLLFVGTSNGVYVSADAGGRWLRLGRNFPDVMVERMALSFEEHELAIATHGRGIYIADIGPLQDMSDSLLAESAHLFAVAPALQARLRNTWPDWGSHPYTAPNPPRAAISYYVRDVQAEGVRIVITSGSDTVRTLNGTGYPGLQRVTWDLLRERPRPRELGAPTAPAELRRVLPGEYVAHLTLGPRKLEQRIVVRDWPQDRLGRIR